MQTEVRFEAMRGIFFTRQLAEGRAVEYRAREVATIYNVTTQTIGVWAREFAEYLTPSANPGSRKMRLFTKDDMRVLSLVSSLQGKGLTFEEIHANLKTGARGELPNIEPEEALEITARDIDDRLSIEVSRLKAALIDAQMALKNAQEDLARLREVEDENIRLRTQLEDERASKETLERQLQNQIDTLTQKIEELALKTGQEYAKGFEEGWSRRGNADEG